MTRHHSSSLRGPRPTSTTRHPCQLSAALTHPLCRPPEEEWSKLSDEDRKKVLQAIVDEEFAKDGMEAPKISFKHEGKMEVMAHGMKAEFGELVES